MCEVCFHINIIRKNCKMNDLRHCCDENHVWNGHQCSSFVGNSTPLNNFHLNNSNFEFSSWNEECPDGTEVQHLFPDYSCYDDGSLQDDGSLVFHDRSLELYYGDFCMVGLQDSVMKGDVMVQACLPQKEKFMLVSFYSYILGTSIFFLSLTIVIYITSPELRNTSNKIIIHFTLALFVSNLVLLFIHNPDLLKEQVGISRVLCQLLGHLEQFSFLSAFTWITIMSSENLNQLRGLSQVNSIQKSPNTMRKQLLLGYGIPFIICSLTGLVDAFAPFCAFYKPRFGQRTCFFYGEMDKFIWFYLPIIIMLIINTVIFVYILVSINRLFINISVDCC